MSLSNDEVVQSLMATMDSINKQLANERKERKEEKKASDEKIAEVLKTYITTEYDVPNKYL